MTSENDLSVVSVLWIYEAFSIQKAIRGVGILHDRAD
jgi:hypothetical protein